jgi:dihydroceramidase
MLAYHYNKKHMELRMVLSLVSLFMIGIGSFCFHATLTYRMQLLDELPMVWYDK